MIRFAQGLEIPVRIAGVRPEILFAVLSAWTVLQAVGPYDLAITSFVEGKHSEKSLHYAGCAFDFDTSMMPAPTARIVAQRLSTALGGPSGDFDVLLEGNHIHVEYQPRRLA